MGIKIFLCIFFVILIGLFTYGLTDEISIALVAIFGSGFIFLITLATCTAHIQTANDIIAQDVFVNGSKVTVQEETMDSQDNIYNILIFGLDTDPQHLDLNEYVFSADTESQTIAIVSKSQISGIKNETLYEVHINGSNINIENLDMNDFTISVDKENRWIVLTEK